MPCGVKETGGVYRPRNPQQTPFYRLVERFYPEFSQGGPPAPQERTVG